MNGREYSSIPTRITRHNRGFSAVFIGPMGCHRLTFSPRLPSEAPTMPTRGACSFRRLRWNSTPRRWRNGLGSARPRCRTSSRTWQTSRRQTSGSWDNHKRHGNHMSMGQLPVPVSYIGTRNWALAHWHIGSRVFVVTCHTLVPGKALAETTIHLSA